MNNYPLASSTWNEKEINAIHAVIAKDMFTMGEKVAEFEHDFAQYIGGEYCVMVNSGSSANLLGIAALFYRKINSLKPGDEVIVPAVSWSTTYTPLHQYGLKLKFVDIDLQTLNYDLDALESAVSDKTRLIVAVNLLGNPNNFDQITHIVAHRNIIIFEDNCESMGAEYKDKKAGGFGIIGTFSTFYSHHIATMEGGMLVTDDEEIYHILCSIRSHGWTRNLPKINKISNKTDDPFEESFKFVLPGYNLRPIEMSGAIGIEQLKKLPFFLQKRRDNAAYFKQLFTESNDFFIQQEIENSSWFGFSLIIKPESLLKRKDVIRKLQQNAIECRPIVSGNFTKNKVMKYFDYEIHDKLNNADYLHSHGFFVGNHHIDISEQIHYLHDVLSS